MTRRYKYNIATIFLKVCDLPNAQHMSFFTYNTASFPILIFEFNNTPINDAYFELFLLAWESSYTHKAPFVLVFDTTNMAIPNPKYCLKMTAFIKKIRKFKPQYLQSSYIAVQSKTIATLLELIFYLQPLVAPVHITRETDVTKVVRCVGRILEAETDAAADAVADKGTPESHHENQDEEQAAFMSSITKVILPSTPFFPFL